MAAHLERALDLAGALGGTGMAAEAALPGGAESHAGRGPAGAAAASLLPDLISAHLASADHAMRTEVPRAVAHLRRALELLPPGDPGRPAVLEQLGRALNSTGDVRTAVAALEEAAGAYRAAGAAAGAAGIAPVLAVALAFTGEGERAQAVLADAREKLADRPGPSLVAVIAEQAMSAMVANRLESAAALAEEAISLGAALGLRPPHRALHARGWVRYPADPDAGEADFRASIDVAVDVGAIQSAGGAMQNLAIARGNVLGPAAALAALDEARTFRAVHGLPEMPVRLSRLDELEVAGDWDAVVAEAEPVRAWAEARGDAWAAWSADFVMASVRLARGERVGSQEDLVARGRDVGMPGYAAPVAALAAIAEGDPSAARGILAAALDGLSPGEIDRPASFVRACVRCGAVDLARRVLELGTTPAPLEAAELLAAEAMLAEAEGDLARARDSYIRAAEALGRLGMRPEEAHALEGLGRCLLALGEADAGAAKLRAARDLWERIGAPPRTAAIDALLGIRLTSSAGEHRPASGAGARPVAAIPAADPHRDGETSRTTRVGASRMVTRTHAGPAVPATQVITASKSPMRTREAKSCSGSGGAKVVGPSYVLMPVANGKWIRRKAVPGTSTGNPRVLDERRLGGRDVEGRGLGARELEDDAGDPGVDADPDLGERDGLGVAFSGMFSNSVTHAAVGAAVGIGGSVAPDAGVSAAGVVTGPGVAEAITGDAGAVGSSDATGAGVGVVPPPPPPEHPERSIAAAAAAGGTTGIGACHPRRLARRRTPARAPGRRAPSCAGSTPAVRCPGRSRATSGVAPRRSRASAAPHTEEDRVPSLTDTSHEHHGVINEHLDRLPVIADSIGRVDVAALRDGFMPEYAFITGRLIRHMTAIEASLYTPLEKLMEGRHSMAPMRREHEELVRLVDSLGDFAAKLEAGTLDPDDGIGLRRALYRLHSIVKVHLAEEELYLGVLDHNLSEEEKDEITRALVHACEQPL